MQIPPVDSVKLTPAGRPASERGAAEPVDRYAPTPEEKQALKFWGNRFRQHGNVLLTPPRGRIDPELAEAREYLRDMVEQLAGDKLQEQGIHLVVNLYSSSSVNAFMTEHAEGKTEDGSRYVHPTARIRKLEGFGPDGKPMYELGMNVGTLRQLEYVEELAFVMAHELSHLFEGHTRAAGNLVERADQWVSSQVHEAAADHQGIELMVAAGYDPEGALVALDRLHAGQPGPSTRTMLDHLRTGAEDHHHEGVRLALASAQVEQLRRKDPAARPRGPLHELPHFLRHLQAPPRPAVGEQGLAQATAALSKAAVEYLTGPLAPDKADYRKFMLVPAQGRPRLSSWNLSPRQAGEALHQAALEAASRPATPQQRTDAILMLFQLAASDWKKVELSPQATTDLRRILLQNSLGAEGWKAEPFLARLEIGTREGPIFCHNAFAEKVLLSPAFMQLAGPLYEVHPEWKRLLDQTPDMVLKDPFEGKPGVMWGLRSMAQGLDREPSGSVERAHQDNLVRLLERMAAEPELLATARDLSFIHQVQEMLPRRYEPKNPAFYTRLTEALKPALAVYAEARDQQALSAFHGDPAEIGSVLRAVFASSALCPFSESFRGELTREMKAFVRRANHEPDFVYDQHGVSPSDNVEFTRFLLETDDPEAFRFLCRQHEPTISLARQGDRARAWEGLGPWRDRLTPESLIDLIEEDATQQHAGLLARSIEHHLQFPVATDTATLAGVGERLKKGEFDPPRPTADILDYSRYRQQEQEYDRLREARYARYKEASKPIQLVLHREANPIFAPLTFLGADRVASERLAGQMEFGQLERIMARIRSTQERCEAINQFTMHTLSGKFSSDAGVFLLDSLVATQPQDPPLERWYAVLERVLDSSENVLEVRSGYRDRLEAYLLPRLEQLDRASLEGWLRKAPVRNILQADNLARLLVKTVDPAADLAGEVRRLDEGLLPPREEPFEKPVVQKLHEQMPQVFARFRDLVAEAHQLQPRDLDRVFPADERSVSDRVKGGSGLIRGLSALVSLTRQQAPEQQLQAIDYLMGRRDELPAFLDTLPEQFEQWIKPEFLPPVSELMRNARSQLAHADLASRVLVASSFLSGPSSLLRDPAGREKLLDEMLKDVQAKNRPLARSLAGMLLDAHGSSDALAVGYILGQPVRGQGKSSEADILNRLFDAYGVPGIKFKQYLAFTAEFAEFREAFEESQDAAMPLNYYEALRLVQARFGDEWPPDLRIEEVKGSGSVNVAVRYWDPAAGEHRILSIARENVETTADYDFMRLRRFLEELTRTPENREKYGYLLGLSEVIRESVTLEFDKAAAFRMQDSVQALYNRQVDGWTIRTVRPFEQKNGAISMEEAPGKTARRIYKEDPAVYRSAMGALCQVEMHALMGIDQSGNPRPVPLLANPDFHDGQVLIDRENRVVTLLDFGQAVPISNAERDYGLDLLGVIGGAYTAGGAARLLRSRSGVSLTSAELSVVMERKDPMDRFIYLLGLMSQKGARVPLPTVHWVLAVNRQKALGEKVGQPTHPMIRNMVITKRLGGSLALYNQLHLARQSAGAMLSGATRAVLDRLGAQARG